MFWKGAFWENVYILQNSSFHRILQNVCSQIAFQSILLTSCSSEGPVIEKSIRRVVSPTAHPKASLSPWKMLSMFLKGGCRGLQKDKSNIIKPSLGQSRSLCVRQWCFISWREPPQNPHSCAFNAASTSVLSSQWHQQSPEPNQNGTTPHSLQRIRENLIQ